MKEIDNMLNQWIHSSVIRAKLRELIVKENFKSFDLGVKPPKTIVFKSKKIYSRKIKHKKNE